MIVDPGMASSGQWEHILGKLAVLEVSPEDITHVFISHHHPDHLTQVGIFPNATLVDYWATYKDDVWSDHPDHFEVAKGVTVIRTPGHTDEDASLLVETREGTYIFTHLWWSPDYQPRQDPLAEDHDDIDEHREWVLQEAEWIVPGHGGMFRNTQKAAKSISKQHSKVITEAVKKATQQWVDAFNRGDAKTAALSYDVNAIMGAKPFGEFIGYDAIHTFWSDLIAKGFDDVEYINSNIEVLNRYSAIVSSDWKMNKAEGVITKELWVLGDDGIAKLRLDDFEVQKSSR
jgi:glyoxylase-like metal-dependent hydrolase (beta-lactamase superfamily II)